MTHLIIPISGDLIDTVRDDMAAAMDNGADMLELRLDRMTDVSDDALTSLLESSKGRPPILLTFRSAMEGGDADIPDLARLERLSVIGPYAHFIDIELATWERSAANRPTIDAALRRAGSISQSGGTEFVENAQRRRLVLSMHDFKGRPRNLQADLLRMVDVPDCDVVKIAWRARTVRDNFEAFELLRLSPKPAIVICMGEEGLLSRILAPKFGAFATFAALTPAAASAPGQALARELLDRYRWRSITARTRVFGVIGDPVAHSLSPDVHSAAFQREQLDAVYVPLRVTPGYEPFKAFFVEMLARPWLDFDGFSITAPHKENAFRLLKERGGQLDAWALRTGAVNTIRIGGDGQLSGWNTDCTAILDVVQSESPVGSGGQSALVLGAGGVARSAVAALMEMGLKVAVTGRTPERAASVSGAFGCEAVPWDARTSFKADMIVNCTPIGMGDLAADSPWPAESLHAGQLVFDTVYHPLETKLLQDAARNGCRTVSGLDLFVRQAAAQFRHWTGREVPVACFREAAEQALARRKTAVSSNFPASGASDD